VKETGVVRRLDELGRIVIPKEIRKRLKIKNGDMVDIYTNDQFIILEKYHPLQADIGPLKAFIEALVQEYKSDIIIIDNAKVIYSTNSKIPIGNITNESLMQRIDNYLDKEISSKVGLEIIEGAKLEKDIYISKIFVNYEHYGYAIIADEMISKKQKELANMLKTYFEHLLEI
jgi:stage V sporulation protein T